MAANVLVDAGFLVALLSRRDAHQAWAVVQPQRFLPPWKTCEAALSEAFHLLGPDGAPALATCCGGVRLSAPFIWARSPKRFSN